MQTPSLLPYLQGTASNLYLDLRNSLVEGQFCPDYRSGLLADGYRVSMRTNAGSLIRKADLHIQPDVVPGAGTIADSWTNIEVDTAWQNACRLHSRRESSACILFNEQVDGEGRLLQFSPLLFCNRRTVFFSPLCRKCLEPLELCRDDTVLQQRGLPLYSRSLVRYLYCPSCATETDSPWYEKIRSPDGVPEVGDKRKLLADMGAVSVAAQSGSGFPCSDCPYQEQCFGERLGVEQTVAVFSFYPFHALLLESTDCNGSDFLVRISGATVDQVATYDRERTGAIARSTVSILNSVSAENGFLRPQGNGAAFTEVLYLKVLFMSEVARQLFSGDELALPAGRYLSPADVRVRFDPFSSLQKFWSFSVVFPGLCSPDILNGRPQPPAIDNFHMLGMFWFLVLGINSEQGESEIYRKLALLLEQDSGSTINIDCLVEFMPPAQVLWEPERYQVDGGSETNYREVLQLGWDILLSAYTGEQPNTTQVCSRIEACLHSLRTLVITGKGDNERGDYSEEDKVIRNVIERLKRKWREEADPVPQTAVFTPLGQVDRSPEENGFINGDLSTGHDFHSETYVLTGEDAPVHESDIHHDETVIIQTESVGQTAATVVSPEIEKPSASAEMEETVRLSPKPAVAQVHTVGETTGPQFLEKTIALGGETPATRQTGGAEAGQLNGKERTDGKADEEDFMTETVGLKPRQERK